MKHLTESVFVGILLTITILISAITTTLPAALLVGIVAGLFGWLARERRLTGAEELIKARETLAKIKNRGGL